MKALARLKLPFKVVINDNKIVIWDKVEIEGKTFYQCLVGNSIYLQLIIEDELMEILKKADN